MELLDGSKVSQEMLFDVESGVGALQVAGVQPKLAVILVGQDPASLSYIKQKQKACTFTGIEWIQHDFEESVTTEELIATVERLNEDESVHGILVQLPLPAHVYTPDVIKAVTPKKDVDGFEAYNLGKMFLSKEFEHLVPCTPKGVIKLLDYYDIDVTGKDVVVVGHSNVVGKPLAVMLMNRGATVTVCHKETKDLTSHTVNADILCVAVGKRNLITEEMVKEGAVVVDIGINRTESGKLVGDVDFENVSKKASFITPVPGGVGPMTVACLMENTLFAAQRFHDDSIVAGKHVKKIY
ncbi:bifunctional methylenetetrahydrofolate dehydrogenase/methenyltetrahydrofolate cyclohydrolase FolD [Candidatus Peregrinibacteria bacterium HGW-Peregrinibacteria-1]|jgi:methylenetetrahydrofolate dehydrogenase (NADP+)/methenyltetrahydrofolate cyclohydrolase|nr:MAG: bifunctional methylenetetrahydrofolate dehydrogenase/methenyltetrahydrofolate cyclohydrolase FolD [Candidatus Peregrinibacteria bacterium HGW-Peregrinibacteria-1]